MDAGPGINFFSINKERLLFGTLGPLAVPEIVKQEILRKSLQDQRFEGAARVMNKVPSRLLQVLSDDVTVELATAVNRITGTPIEQRVRSEKDLGETMVVAHAVVAAERGEHVTVLIDENGGRRMAALEASRLQRLSKAGSTVGSIAIINTIAGLAKAAGREHLPDRRALRELYKRLRGLDDGLVPIDDTGLLDLSCWS